MNDLTVTCGCGRRMTLDTMRGRGAYRCGCGVAVTVIQPKSRPLCVGIDKAERCVLTAVRESAEYGLPLCGDHLNKLKLYMHAAQVGRQYAEQQIAEGSAIRNAQRQTDAEKIEQARADGNAVVYYMRIGDVIKIGTTTNLKNRMTALMPDELLATEPGHRELETMRHRQFAHLKVRGERFRPGEDLLSHIDMIRRHYGSPPGQSDTPDVPDVPQLA